MVQPLAVTGGHGRIELNFTFLARAAFGLLGGSQGLLHPGFARRWLALTHFGQHLCEQLLGQFGVPEQGRKQLIKDLHVLLAVDQHRTQSSVKVVFALKADKASGFNGQCHALAVNGHTRPAQGAAKTNDVFGQLAAARIPEFHAFKPAAAQVAKVRRSTAPARPHLHAA